MQKISSYLEKLFYLLFFFLFVFSFLLIETEYRYFLYAAWSIFLLFYSLLWKIKIKINLEILSLTLFIIFLGIGLFNSHYFILSLGKFIFYCLAVAIYCFFRFLPEEKWQKEKFFDYFLILGLVLNALVFVLSFFPNLRFDITGINLLVRNYGHNHYAAFLLLMLPIYWWQLSKKKHLLAMLALLSSYVLMFISLGRVALFLSFIQFIVVFSLFKSHLWQSQNKGIKVFIKSLLMFFLISLFAYLLFLTPLGKKGVNFCQLNFVQKELCRPIHNEARLSYWQTAWRVFREYPLFGYGLKTFYFAGRSLVFEQLSTQSAYAHNIFLHLLAESGFLVLLSFLLFLIKFFSRLFCQLGKLIKTRSDFLLMLCLAIVSSLANALLDFDFNFFIIFSLTLIFMAIVMRTIDQNSDKQIAISGKKLVLWPAITLLSLINILLLGNYMLSSYYLKRENFGQLLKLFPVVELQNELMSHQSQLTPSYLEELSIHYQYDPGFLFNLLRIEHISAGLRLQANLQLLKIDPVAFLSTVSFAEMDLKPANHIIEALLLKNDQGFEYEDNYFNDWRQRLALAQEVFDHANENYLLAEYLAADRAYRLAWLFDPYIFSNHRAVFLDETDREKAEEFLLAFSLQPQLMHENFYSFMSQYNQVLLDLFEQNEVKRLTVLADKVFSAEPNFSVFLFKDLAKLTFTEPNSQYREQKINTLKEIYQHYQDYVSWEEVKAELTPEQRSLIF